MTIRNLKITDYDKCYVLWQTEHMGLNNIDDSRDGIERYLRRNPNTCFAAEIDGEIVGVVLSGNDGRNGYLSHVCVLREHQNQKIGTQLLEKVFEALKAEGISEVTVPIYTDNKDGQRFYERLGFVTRDFLMYKTKVLVEREWYD